MDRDVIAPGVADERAPLLGGDANAHRREDDASRDNRRDHAGHELPDKLIDFCERLDIVPPPADHPRDASYKPKENGDWAKIRSSVWNHKWYSYGLTALAVMLVILQSGLGIVISVTTSLQGNRAKTAVIILGAINSFVGALAGILQYWGQPTRERRCYASLKGVQSDVEQLIGEFKNIEVNKDPYREGDRIMEKYKQVKADAWANEPMIWIQNTNVPSPGPG